MSAGQQTSPFPAFSAESRPPRGDTFQTRRTLDLESLARNPDSQMPLDDSARWMAVSISPDGLIVSLSSSAELLTGYSARELAGRPVTQIMADRSVFEVPQMMESAREWGGWTGEVSHRTRSGKQVTSRSSGPTPVWRTA